MSSKKSRKQTRHKNPDRGRKRGRGQGHTPEKSRARGQKKYVGKVQKNPKGFAFILPEDPKTSDAYVPKEDAQALLNGDTVEYTLQREGRRASARILKVLKHSQREVVGEVIQSGDYLYLSSLDGEVYDLEEPVETPLGDWAIAEIIEYPTERHRALVRIKEELGPELLPRHDYEIAIVRHSLPSYFSERTLESQIKAKQSYRQALDKLGKRRDLRELAFITIDGEDAKDFDDAVLVELPKKGPAFILHVAIADVSFFVRTGEAVDVDARERSTSVYFPGWCLPMLPEFLSNDLCSLRPQVDRLTLNAEIHFDREGRVEESFFYEGVSKTKARMTYTEVQAYFDTKKLKPDVPREVGTALDAAYTLYRKLLNQRKARGVLDFELPECRITVDASGFPTGVKRAERLESHKLIEEFMIAANQAVAKALREAKQLALYRVHEPPDPKTIDDINHLMRTLGISKSLKALTSEGLSHLLESTASLKGAKILHQSILRLQKQARYEPAPKGHFGLALEDYAHFTSPIRRYPDLVVHRALKRLIRADGFTDKRNESEDVFAALGAETSEKERRAMEAERFVTKRKQCWFMEEHVGETFRTLISGLTSGGLFLEIPEFALDGYLPLEEMNGHYEFDEARMCLRKRPGHTTLTLGDEVVAKVVRVSVDENQITFSQLDP
jgi:ribonuclease R